MIIVANLANAFLDRALIFGRAGFPECGVAGAAWATVACRWLMFVLLLAVSSV
ncbi:MAG: hypothetical protein R3F56_01450 [Planctomycetota bacterium]